MISGSCKIRICILAILSALTAIRAYADYGFVQKAVLQGETGFVCEYDEFAGCVQYASAWDGGAALKLSSGVALPEDDADGMVSYSWKINAPADGIYRIILNATRPAENDYYSDWVLEVNGERADVVKGTAEENNQTFANRADVRLLSGANTLKISVAPRKRGGGFWFILDKMRLCRYEPDSAATAVVENMRFADGVLGADITNTFTDDFYADVYAARFTGESLCSLEKRTVLFEKGQQKTAEFSVGAQNGDILKLLVWNSTTMLPCAEPEQLTVNAVDFAPLNVFEQERGIRVSFAADDDTGYTVYDYFDNEILSGTASASDGTAELTVSGGLPVGWYSVRSGDKQLAAFSVVPEYDGRSESSSPFAADFAAAWLVKNSSGTDYDKIAQYCRAIRLAGIDTVRERVSPGAIDKGGGMYDFSGLHKTTRIMKANDLDVSAVFHSAPDWAKEEGGSFYGELSDIYAFMKNAAAAMGDEVDSWEIWNEQDEQLYSTETADRYAAFFKAAAIGAADGGDAKKILGGLAQSPRVRNYCELMLENDVLRYADAYNYHTYTKDSGADTAYLPANSMQAHYMKKTAYDSGDTPIWITETGVHCAVGDDGRNLAPAQKKLQARCAVTNQVTALANGARRVFWFVIPSYNENGKNFGAFTSDHMPNPAYSAMSVMTDVLKKAEYIGEMKADGVNAYVFDTGEQSCAVLWADSERTVSLPVSSGYIVDIMGGKTDIEPSWSISVGPDPIYLVSDDILSAGCYFSQSFPAGKAAAGDFSEAERIVLCARPEISSRTEAKFRGYRVSANDTIPVEIYNFNNKAVTGELRACAEFDGTVTVPGTVSIPPMGKTTVNISIAADGAVGEEMYNIRVYGIFGGEETTSAVMRVIFTYPQSKLDEITLYKSDSSTDTQNPGAWRVNNISGGSAAADIDDGSVRFSVNFQNSGTRWFYPVFKTPPAYNSGVKNSKGFAFTVGADRDYDNVYLNAMLYYDGAVSLFYLGSKPYTIKQGTHTYFVPWEAFVYSSGTVGTERTVTPGKVTSVSVGLNSYTGGTVEYTVSNVGYYFENEEKAKKSVRLTEENGVIGISTSGCDADITANGRTVTKEELAMLGRGKYFITAALSDGSKSSATDFGVFYIE